MNVQILDKKLQQLALKGILWAMTIGFFLYVAFSSLWGIHSLYRDHQDAMHLVQLFKSRQISRHLTDIANGPDAKLAFVGGSSLSLANAALMKKLTESIKSAGGEVVSSEVSPPKPDSQWLQATAHIQIQEDRLQGLLYSLESGVPYLFVENLSVAENGTPDTAAGLLQATITVSGAWRGKQ